MERLTGQAPEQICALFQDGCAGAVEMVNSRGIYLQLENQHILLCSNRYGAVPNGVALEEWSQLHRQVAVGEPVRIEGKRLKTSSGSWELCLRSLPKDTRSCLPDEKSISLGIDILLAGTKNTGLSALAFPLFAGKMPELNVYCNLALSHVRGLLRACEEEDTVTIRQSVAALLGLGPGLTPSGDDLLSGILYGLRHSPTRNGAASVALRDAIGEMAAQRTNVVSADYLMAIADDAPFDRMAAAWEHPALGAEALMQIGSNSGTEMLLGLMCAGAILHHKKTDPA